MNTAATARVARKLPGGARPPGTSPVILDVPLPPSANNLFAAFGRRRTKSKRYREWLLQAKWELQIQRPHRIAGDYGLAIALPSNCPGDIDNRVKALSDLLVTMNVVDDDSRCRKLTIEHDRTITAVRLTVTPITTGTGAPA